MSTLLHYGVHSRRRADRWLLPSDEKRRKGNYRLRDKGRGANNKKKKGGKGKKGKRSHGRGEKRERTVMNAGKSFINLGQPGSLGSKNGNMKEEKGEKGAGGRETKR